MGQPLDKSEILELAVEIEGHPDNVTPALYGGLVLAIEENGRYLIEPIPTPPMEVVIVLPDFHLPTAEARAALPKQVPLTDAVFNAGRVGLLVRTLAAGDYNRLAAAMTDRLHQPYRLPLIPGMNDAFKAAKNAGAAAVALSGAGPSLVAFVPAGHQAIAQAAQTAFANAGLFSRSWILPIDEQGSQVSST
jgi:homoserine kinase